MRAPPAEAAGPVPCTVAAVGLDGDGVATLPDGTTLYLPVTLPGERVRAVPNARRGGGLTGPFELVDASPDRVEPPCPHFPECGGCTVQHWADAPYAAWKAGLVAQALRRAGFEVEPGPMSRTPPLARRRMDLAIRRAPGGNVPEAGVSTATVPKAGVPASGVIVGLHRPRSGEVVDLHTCLVLDPALFALVAPLRALMGRLRCFRREASAVVNLLDTGPDLLLRSDAVLETRDRTLLAGFAQEHGLARICWAKGDGEPETACSLRPAQVVLSGVAVSPAPGAFLQASPQGEAAIIAAVLAGLPAKMRPKARIVELFAGYGTLSLPLAAHGRVVAYEGDEAACLALRRASGGRIEVVRRDLQRQPPQLRELGGTACVVLDPPWTGAGATMAPLMAAKVPRVIYVSCNPVVLGRDAIALKAAGYRLLSVAVIDQFLWSSRVEAVAVFALEGRK